MKEFTQLLNWRLLKGSHDFPGPDGGTCINEAAMVVAGFPYKEIKMVDDLPRCFSRPLGELMLGLNDGMNDEHRQLLVKYATRLSGSADSMDVEAGRVTLAISRTVREFLVPTLRSAGFLLTSKDLTQASFEEYVNVLGSLEFQKGLFSAYDPSQYLASAKDQVSYALVMHLKTPSLWEVMAMGHLASAWLNLIRFHTAKPSYYTPQMAVDMCFNIADSIFAIGNQANPIEGALITERVAQAKAKPALKAALLAGV